MAGVNQATVKTVNIPQSKIDVVKFDGTNNLRMWRCKLMNALNTPNLKESLNCKRIQRIFQKRIGRR